MIPVFKVPALIRNLHEVTTKMANDIELIRTGMTGKGVSPAHAPVIEMRLQEIENKLRMLGANEDNPIPWIA